MGTKGARGLKENRRGPKKMDEELKDSEGKEENRKDPEKMDGELKN
jgi:hypothetical protein